MSSAAGGRVLSLKRVNSARSVEESRYTILYIYELFILELTHNFTITDLILKATLLRVAYQVTIII